jgi:hypothetical protein
VPSPRQRRAPGAGALTAVGRARRLPGRTSSTVPARPTTPTARTSGCARQLYFKFSTPADFLLIGSLSRTGSLATKTQWYLMRPAMSARCPSCRATGGAEEHAENYYRHRYFAAP